MSDYKKSQQQLPAHLRDDPEDGPVGDQFSDHLAGKASAKTPKRSNSRSAARLAAVQALYQRHMESTPTTRLLNEFHQHRLGKEIEDVQYAKAEVDFFDDIVSGVIARHDEINDAIISKLAQGWTIARLDKTMLQILRAGAYELIARKDVATGTVINEYVDVAHAFFDQREAKFVNGVLDSIAKTVRPKAGKKKTPAPSVETPQAETSEPDAAETEFPETDTPDSDLAG